MKRYKLISHDVVHGGIASLSFWIIPVLTYFMLALDMVVKIIILKRAGMDFQASAGDLFFYIFAGRAMNDTGNGVFFEIPVHWMVGSIICTFSCLNYPFKELNGYGRQILIRGRSRSQWWFSKCAWVLFRSISFYMLAWLTVFVVAAIWSGGISLNLNQELLRELLMVDITDIHILKEKINIVLFMQLLTYSTLNLIQISFSIFIGPLLGFIVMLVLYILSIYYMHPLLIGNYSMLLRSNLFFQGGLDYRIGISICIVMCITVVLVTNRYFRRLNILGGE